MPTTRRPKRPTRESLPADSCLCDHCTGKCCRYFSLPIHTPESWDDFDEIRWFISHDRTIIYVHEDTWYLLVMSRCQYLLPDHRCGIYLTRPKICREYTTDDCEYDSDWQFDRLFETPEQIWEYAEAVLPPRRPRKSDRPPGPLVQIGG